MQIDILNTEGTWRYAIKAVIDAEISQSLSGEYTLSFSVPSSRAEELETGYTARYQGQLFTVMRIRKTMNNGLAVSSVYAEHVSYTLNDYTVDDFAKSGTGQEILTEVLSGTSLKAGEVDITGSYSLAVNTSTNRRALLMQLVGILGGELDFYGNWVMIKSHRGSSTIKELLDTGCVSSLDYSSESGSSIASYSISLRYPVDISLGDEIHIKYSPFGIDENTRIVSIKWNPFHMDGVSITSGTYKATIDDTLYSIQEDISETKEAVTKIETVKTEFTIEFGEITGNGTFFFTRQYDEEPLYQAVPDDDSQVTLTITKSEEKYIGGTLTGAGESTKTLVVCYCTMPE